MAPITSSPHDNPSRQHPSQPANAAPNWQSTGAPMAAVGRPGVDTLMVDKTPVQPVTPFLMVPATFLPPVGSTAAARRHVHQLAETVDKTIGFWGRNWVKLTAPTLVGLAVGLPLRRRAAARAASHLSRELEELQGLKAIVGQVPVKERSAAQKRLLRDIDRALERALPTYGTLAKEAGKSIAAATLGLLVSTVLLSLAVGVGIAAQDGSAMEGIFCIPYGLPHLAGCSVSGKEKTKALKGDELPLAAAVPIGYHQPKNIKGLRWA